MFFKQKKKQTTYHARLLYGPLDGLETTVDDLPQFAFFNSIALNVVDGDYFIRGYIYYRYCFVNNRVYYKFLGYNQKVVV